jgi:hypothetical protein
MTPKDLPMNGPAEGGMKQNSLSQLKALLLTSATQQCLISDQMLDHQNKKENAACEQTK